MSFPRASGKDCRNFSLALSLSWALLIVSGLYPAAAHAAELKLIPMLGLREERNDNLLFDSSGADEISDRITTVSPGVAITDRTERLDTLLQTRFNIIRYVHSGELDTTDQDHSGRVSCLPNERLRISVEGGFTKDSRADRDIETTGLILGTARRNRTRYAFSSDCTLSEKAGVTLVYVYSDERFDSPDFTDSTTQDANVILRYDLNPFIPSASARVNAGYGFYDFTDMHVVNYSVSAGASKQFSETLSLSADIGRSLTRSSSETSSSFFTIDDRSTERGTIGNLTLGYTGEQTSGTVALLQERRALSGRPGTTRRTSVRLGISRRFTYDLTGDVSAEYFLNKTDEEQPSNTEMDEETLRIQPLLTYRVTKELTLSASYRFTRLKDHATDERITQSMGFLGIAWQYPVPHT